MIPILAWYLMLVVFSGLSVNLILQFGIGLKAIALDESLNTERLLIGAGIIFITVIFLWLVFLSIRSVLFLGLLEYVLLFPLCLLVSSLLEYLANRFILKSVCGQGETLLLGNTMTVGALCGAALFLTLNVAGGFLEVVFLSLGFSCSAALVFAVAGEIRRRAEMEAVPRWLRGGPLALIAIGLLSLIFSSGALMLFGILH